MVFIGQILNRVWVRYICSEGCLKEAIIYNIITLHTLLYCYNIYQSIIYWYIVLL